MERKNVKALLLLFLLGVASVAAERTNKHVVLAKLAEQAGRYNDMRHQIKELFSSNPELNEEMRNLLSVAYKNVVGPLRRAWRTMSFFTTNAIEGNYWHLETDLAKGYRDKIEKELKETCNEVQDILTALLESDLQTEDEVFYLTMKGDYQRYLAEINGINNDEAAKSYEAAMVAAEQLVPTNPIRLRLVLNFSVYNYEVLGNRETACTLAKNAFDNALAKLDNLNDQNYKDSTLLMQLLRDNVTLWTAEEDEHEEDN